MAFGSCQGGTYTLARSGVKSRVGFVLLGMKKGLLNCTGHSRPMLSSSKDVPQGMTMGLNLRIKDCRGGVGSTCLDGEKTPLPKDWPTS